MFFKRKKLVERWNMAMCTSTETETIQNYLNQGYEPFGVITKPVPLENKNIKSVKKEKSFKIIEIIYFKQKINVLLETKSETVKFQKNEK